MHMKLIFTLFLSLSVFEILCATTTLSPAAINCDFDSDKTQPPGCPFQFFVTEFPAGDCSVEREWCMLIRYANFSMSQGTTTCRNNKATQNKCDTWGLCKKLMKGKSENRGCFVKTNVNYTNPKNGRMFHFPQVYVYCCKSGDRCNHPTRYGNFSTCNQLTSWPPTS